MPYKKIYKRKPLRKYKAKPKPAIQRSLKYIQNYVHPIVTCTKTNFFIDSINGFSNAAGGSGATTSPSIQFQFTQNTVYYKLGGSAAFAMTTFANSSSLTNVYDCYRLKKVVCSWLYGANSAATNVTAHVLPVLYTVLDKDDSSSLGSAQIALAYCDCKITQLGNMRGDGMQYITLTNPATETDVTTTTNTFVSAVRGINQWMDTDDTSAAYNGIKMFVECPNTSSQVLVGTLTVFFRCYFEYKESH